MSKKDYFVIILTPHDWPHIHTDLSADVAVCVLGGAGVGALVPPAHRATLAPQPQHRPSSNLHPTPHPPAGQYTLLNMKVDNYSPLHQPDSSPVGGPGPASAGAVNLCHLATFYQMQLLDTDSKLALYIQIQSKQVW